MPVLNIQGKRVNIGEDFLNLSPEEQNKTVEEIASQMNIEAAPTDQTQDNLNSPQARQPDVNSDQQILDELNRQQGFAAQYQKNPVKYSKVVNGQPYDESGIPLGGPVTLDQAKSTDPIAGLLDEKGDITTNVWDNMDYTQALRAYNGLANHPDTQKAKNQLGGEELVFRGHVVPFPEPSLFGGSSPSSSRIMQRGFMDGITNLAQLGLSVIDSATGSNLSPSMDYPEQKSGSIGDSLSHDVLPVFMGGAGGLKAATGITEGVGKVLGSSVEALRAAPGPGKFLAVTADKAGTIAKGATRIAGAELGTTAPLDEDTSGILVGDESVLKSAVGKSWEPFTVDEKASEGSQTFAKKMNLAMDSFVSGSVLAGAGRLVGKAGELAHNIYTRDVGPLASQNAQMKNVNRDILADLGLPEGASSAEKASFADRMNGYLDSGRSSFSELDVDLDPIAAIAQGARAAGDKETANRAEILRNDIFGSNLPQTRGKQEEYLNEVIPGYKDDIYQAGGGEAGVEKARKGIIDSSEQDRQAFKAPVDQATTDLATENQSLKTLIETDPQFGATIDDLSKNTNISIHKGVNTSEDRITQSVMNAEKVLTQKRDNAVQKLPSGVKVDNSFESLVKQANEETGELEFRPFLNNREKEIIDHADGSFKVLYSELVPALSKRIDSLKNGDPLLRGELQNIRDNIVNGQVSSLVQRGAKASTLQKIQDVKDSFKTYYRFFGKGSPLEGVRKANRGIIPGNVGTEEVATQKSRQTVLSTLGNENREKTGALVELLSSPAGNQSQDSVVDLYIGRSLQPLRSKIQKGEITDLDVEDFVKNLGNDAASLEKSFPQAYQKAQTFVDNLKASKNKVATLEEQLKTAQTTFDQADSVLKKEMAPFYDSSGVENTRGQKVFEDIFNSGGDTTSQIKQLVNRANGTNDPEVLKGIQGAFGQKLKSVGLNEFDKDPEKFMGVARELFKTDPDVLQGIEEAYRLERITEVGKGTRLGALTGAASTEQKALASVNKLITLFFGVLNPTATRIRTVAGALAKDRSPRESMINLIGEVSSDPDKFKEMLGKFNPEDVFNGRNKQLIYEFGARAGMWDTLGDPQREFDQNWNSMQQDTMNEDARSKSQKDTDKALK